LAAGDRNAVTNPTVLIEVLSDSTEDYDRAGKFDSYREILSLQEYVLVSHHEPLIEVFRRRDDADWIRTAARAGGSVPLESIACTLQVDRVYRDVTLSG
jgi:Uma2 family endonuclease